MDCLIKRETAEYKREGLECDHIEYPDNGLQVRIGVVNSSSSSSSSCTIRPHGIPPSALAIFTSLLSSLFSCRNPLPLVAQIELIDAKKLGVFALLDDECSQPKASDEKFVSRMNDAFPSHRIYATQGVGKDEVGPDLGKEMAAKQFVINHYAEKVVCKAIQCHCTGICPCICRAYARARVRAHAAPCPCPRPSPRPCLSPLAPPSLSHLSTDTANKWLLKNRGQLNVDLANVLSSSGSLLLQTAYQAHHEGDKKAL